MEDFCNLTHSFSEGGKFVKLTVKLGMVEKLITGKNMKSSVLLKVIDLAFKQFL